MIALERLYKEMRAAQRAGDLAAECEALRALQAAREEARRREIRAVFRRPEDLRRRRRLYRRIRSLEKERDDRYPHRRVLPLTVTWELLSALGEVAPRQAEYEYSVPGVDEGEAPTLEEATEGALGAIGRTGAPGHVYIRVPGVLYVRAAPVDARQMALERSVRAVAC